MVTVYYYVNSQVTKEYSMIPFQKMVKSGIFYTYTHTHVGEENEGKIYTKKLAIVYYIWKVRS